MRGPEGSQSHTVSRVRLQAITFLQNLNSRLSCRRRGGKAGTARPKKVEGQPAEITMACKKLCAVPGYDSPAKYNLKNVMACAPVLHVNDSRAVDKVLVSLS